MKIVDIRTIPLSYRCDPPYGSAGLRTRGGDSDAVALIPDKQPRSDSYRIK